MKTLKFLAIFCLSALAFVGCETSSNDDSKGDNSSKQLLLVADKTTIYDNGEDAVTFTLYYDGMTLKEGYEIYEGETLLANDTFASTVQGTHTIWASYGALISNEVSVNVVATPPAAPAAPEDTNPEKSNFKRRVLLTQFTGTGCGYCPYMMNALYEAATSTEYGDKIVIAAAHLYNKNGDGDPAHLFDALTLDDAMGVYSYPNLVTDLDKSSKDIQYFYAPVAVAINAAYNRVAVKGGIAVNSEYHAEENYIVINATVKAKETTEFRIGAWLLEDNITGKQNNGGATPLEGVNFNTHENCIRIANSKKSNIDFSGFDLGTIEAGKTVSREFAFPLKPNGPGNQKTWRHENLRVIVFISTKEGSKWLVNNVVKCPKDGSVNFEYED